MLSGQILKFRRVRFYVLLCVIPFARGRARSRDWHDLFTEAEQMIQKGVREIVLTGVNLGTYLSNENDFLTLIDSLDLWMV